MAWYGAVWYGPYSGMVIASFTLLVAHGSNLACGQHTAQEAVSTRGVGAWV